MRENLYYIVKALMGRRSDRLNYQCQFLINLKLVSSGNNNSNNNNNNNNNKQNKQTNKQKNFKTTGVLINRSVRKIVRPVKAEEMYVQNFTFHLLYYKFTVFVQPAGIKLNIYIYIPQQDYQYFQSRNKRSCKTQRNKQTNEHMNK